MGKRGTSFDHTLGKRASKQLRQHVGHKSQCLLSFSQLPRPRPRSNRKMSAPTLGTVSPAPQISQQCSPSHRGPKQQVTWAASWVTILHHPPTHTHKIHWSHNFQCLRMWAGSEVGLLYKWSDKMWPTWSSTKCTAPLQGVLLLGWVPWASPASTRSRP